MGRVAAAVPLQQVEVMVMADAGPQGGQQQQPKWRLKVRELASPVRGGWIAVHLPSHAPTRP